jgi:Flp pilus assembly protein TadB
MKRLIAKYPETTAMLTIVVVGATAWVIAKLWPPLFYVLFGAGVLYMIVSSWRRDRRKRRRPNQEDPTR